jgi:hypothetical protein
MAQNPFESLSGPSNDASPVDSAPPEIAYSAPSPNRRTRQMTGNRRRPKSPRFSIPIKSPWRAKRRLSNGARLRFPISGRAARACCLRPPTEYLIWMERTPISCCPRGSAGRWAALRISPMLAAHRRHPLPGLTPTRCDTRVPSNWCASAGSSAVSNCKGVLKPAAGWDTLHSDRLSSVLRSRAGTRCAPWWSSCQGRWWCNKNLLLPIVKPRDFVCRSPLRYRSDRPCPDGTRYDPLDRLRNGFCRR